MCNDDVTIAKAFTLKDPDEHLGAQLLRGAAERTGDAAGDGTTRSTILAHAIVADGMKNIAAAARILSPSPTRRPSRPRDHTGRLS